MKTLNLNKNISNFLLFTSSISNSSKIQSETEDFKREKTNNSFMKQSIFHELEKTNIATEGNKKLPVSSSNFYLIESLLIHSNSNEDYLTPRPFATVTKDSFNSYLSQLTTKDINNLMKDNDQSSNQIASENASMPFYSLDHLIESTYNFDTNYLGQMNYKQELFKTQIYKWRKIKGDGNCFYRAVIIAFIEKIILLSNKQLLMNLIYDIKICFSDQVILSKLNIKYNFTLNNRIVLQILIIIYNNVMKGDIGKAYDIFIQCLVSCDHFDYGLILYLRFIIYRYIKDNEGKLYTKDFPIKIGNLLPLEYEVNDGIFLFEEFYEKYLLKMFQDAEKIIIYILPFVLCANLNIVMFELEFDCLKEFTYHEAKDSKNNSITISLLNNKSHYDLIYTESEYNKWNWIFNNYQPKSCENIILPKNNSYNKRTEGIGNYGSFLDNKYKSIQSQRLSKLINFTNVSVLYDQDEDTIKTSNRKKGQNKYSELISSSTFGLLDDDDNMYNNCKISIINKDPPKKQISFCAKQSMRCQSFNVSTEVISKYKIKQKSLCPNCCGNGLCHEELAICQKCFYIEFNKCLFGSYLKYLRLAKEKVMKSPTNLSFLISLHDSILIMRPLSIFNKKIVLSEALEFINSNIENQQGFNEMLLIIKRKICLYCEKGIINSIFKMPCGCVFCSKECLNIFFTKYKVIIEIQDSAEYVCLCGFNYEPYHIYSLTGLMFSNNKDKGRLLFQLFLRRIRDICFICTNKIEKKSDMMLVECQEISWQIEQYLGFSIIPHSICKSCCKKKLECAYCSMCCLNHIININKL